MKRKIIQHACTAVILLCVAAAAVMGYRLIQKERQYREDRRALDGLYAALESARRGAAPEKAGEPKQGDGSADLARAALEAERQRTLAGYAALQAQNSDMIGWVKIDGSQVDYPVMHTPKIPEYYINRNFEKKRSAYGMIFLDAGCRTDGSSPNMILYGHHMKDGAMFAQIENYDDRAFWEKHRLIRFDTLSDTGTYEVIGAFKQPASRLDESFKKMLMAETREDYGALMEFLKEKRFYDTGLEPTYPERLVTLTTCEYTYRDGRFFVVARRVDGSPAPQ